MNHYTVHWRSELPGPERDISTLRALFGLVLDDGESGKGGEVAQALGAELTDELRELIHGATERYVNYKLDRETAPTAKERSRRREPPRRSRRRPRGRRRRRLPRRRRP